MYTQNMDISNINNTTSHRHHKGEEEEEERDTKYSDNNLPIISISSSDQAVLTLTPDDGGRGRTSEENNDKNENDKAEPAKGTPFRYMECMRNHAASIGGNSRDGCGEFIPSSSSDSNDDNHHRHESLYCSVCNCHRNFHRKEFIHHDHHHRHRHDVMRSRSFYPYPRHPPMIMPCNSYHFIASGAHKYSDEQEVLLDDNNNNKNIMGPSGNSKKRRFRTKFSQEQREKMLRFAEGVGWKIHKEEESVVKSFCQEIGVKRRVLKVWMHNNKNSKLPKTVTVKHPTSSS